MKQKERKSLYQNCIWALAATGISALLMGLLFDFYFDLNDDTMMRDIMAGIYSGTPSGYNMQTLYPLGALLSLCYRLCRALPWYGIFLWLCQFGCFSLIGIRLLSLMQTRRGKALSLLSLYFFQWGIWLTHMVNIQYTITCAMLSAAAVFWFLTTPQGISGKTFVWKNLPGILLVVLAYQLRSEMLLLTLPFVGFALFVRWWEETAGVQTGGAEVKRFCAAARQLPKYGAALGLILLGMALSLGLDTAAYGSAEWKDFRRFFDDRTIVYDYYMEVVTDDAYSGDLQKLGISPAQQTLLSNYNFGLDESIDTQLLEKAASYAEDTVGGARDWKSIFREKLMLYRYRLFHADDMPYNLLVLFGYAGNIIAAVILFQEMRFRKTAEDNAAKRQADAAAGKRRLFRTMVQLVLLILLRTALWLFILVRGRDPERITHSLYLVEFMVLAALLLRQQVCVSAHLADGVAREADVPRRRAIFLRGFLALLLLLMAGRLPISLPAVMSDQSRREEINRDWQDIDGYCRARTENFYFEDVYSTVAFSGKLFAGENHAFSNYDIAGGWICKSPLWQKKLSQYEIGAADEALLDGSAYFIMSDAEKRERGLSWLADYYAEQDIETGITECDRINENYGVYRVEAISEGE